MKIYLVNPMHRLSIEIFNIVRRLGIRRVLAELPSRKKAIVIANGTPDNIVVALLTEALNHKDVVDLLFPEYKHIGIIDWIPKYVEEGYEKISVILDQEEYSLEKLYTILSSKLGKYNMLTERVLEFKILRGSESADIIICINGINDFSVKKHSIEDHLLSIARELGIEYGLDNNSSKEAWFKLGRDDQFKVFKYIIEHKEAVERYFIQQHKSLSLLKS